MTPSPPLRACINRFRARTCFSRWSTNPLTPDCHNGRDVLSLVNYQSYYAIRRVEGTSFYLRSKDKALFSKNARFLRPEVEG